MTPTSNEAAACAGKFPFPNATIARRSVRSGMPMTPYRCSYCGQYHVGKKNTRPHPSKDRT